MDAMMKVAPQNDAQRSEKAQAAAVTIDQTRT
jgi:hypothetical protein